MKATDSQVRYLCVLLGQKGYSTRCMNAEFKELGGSMRERSGTVEGWLRGLDVSRASKLIQKLQESR